MTWRHSLLAALACVACRDAGATSHSDRALPPAQADAQVKSGPAPVAYVASARLAQAAAALARSGATTATVTRSGDAWVIQGLRRASGSPEVHRAWMDVVYVQAGRGVLQTSATLSGGREVSDGELRGGTILDGRRQQLAAGDVVVIPAGTAHQYLIAAGDSLRYVTVKVR